MSDPVKPGSDDFFAIAAAARASYRMIVRDTLKVILSNVSTAEFSRRFGSLDISHITDTTSPDYVTALDIIDQFRESRAPNLKRIVQVMLNSIRDDVKISRYVECLDEAGSRFGNPYSQLENSIVRSGGMTGGYTSRTRREGPFDNRNLDSLISLNTYDVG